MNVRGLAVSPDGRYAFVTHLLANYHLTTTHIEQGWMNMNVVSVVDLAKREPLNTVLLDDMSLGAGNPWGVACTPDGRRLVIAHAGSHELSVIDLPAMLRTLRELYPSRLAGGTPGTPSILGDMRRRVPLPGKGPRAVAVVGGKAMAGVYYSDTLESLDLARPGSPGPRPSRWARRRRGRTSGAARCSSTTPPSPTSNGRAARVAIPTAAATP